MDKLRAAVILTPMNRFHVAVIGGGGTGAATAWDLSRRGFRVTVLERGELTSGTTGRHHGQLHSGARYALADRTIARECMVETLILRRIAADCMEYNQGLFIALDEAEAALAAEFVDACRGAGIGAVEIPVRRALAMEGAVNPLVLKAVLVPDGTIDAYRLPMRFFASAAALGADIRTFTEVVGIDRSRGAVTTVRAVDHRSGKPVSVSADAVVNAAGPWADRVARLAGAEVALTAAAGTMVAVEGRMTDMVVSRLRRPGDGDILVPQRKLSIIGSTQRIVADRDGLAPTEGEIAFLRSAADNLVPGFSARPVRAAWTAARPLAGRSSDDGRSISRDFVLIDHGKKDGVRGLFTMLGGKATTLRAMAETASDAVDGYFGTGTRCGTATAELAPYADYWRQR